MFRKLLLLWPTLRTGHTFKDWVDLVWFQDLDAHHCCPDDEVPCPCHGITYGDWFETTLTS